MSFWNSIKNFKKEEFDCQHTGENNMDEDFVRLMDLFRKRVDMPVIITSGYRHEDHPIEAAKSKPGEHSKGTCADIKFNPRDLGKMISVAHELGIKRIGISFKKRFLHLGIGDRKHGFPATSWGY